MEMKNKINQRKIVGAVCFLLAGFLLWTVVAGHSPRPLFVDSSDKNLIVAFLSIGQGDAIYIQSPSGHNVMFDGGPDSGVLRRLGEVMPFYQRTIDTLVVTNPDKDHMAGFIDILKAYKVGRIIEPGTHSPSATYAELERAIVASSIKNGTKKIIAQAGMVLDLGAGARIDFIFPDQDVSSWTTNDGSIVARLVYASTSVMLMGDAPKKTEDYLVEKAKKNPEAIILESDILKVGHHGSKTSSTEKFVMAVNPMYAIISAGLKNSYGHPHPSTIATLKKFLVKILVTFEKGTIIFKSDGQKWLAPEFIP